jgi:DNA-binding protein Fis
LACGIFASMGPRNVYKDILNNMVSPINHVVMNHQNHNRTNGI